jgi:hypothetical protein
MNGDYFMAGTFSQKRDASRQGYDADFHQTDFRQRYFTTSEHDLVMALRRYILVSTIGGVLFVVLDTLLNANPLAMELYAVFQPISRSEINVPAGVFIDLAYGFILAALFLLLYRSLPGTSDIAKGISFAFMLWFLRVVMSALSQWMMVVVPVPLLLYLLGTGLFEMLVLGIFYGATLRPEGITEV